MKKHLKNQKHPYSRKGEEHQLVVDELTFFCGEDSIKNKDSYQYDYNMPHTLQTVDGREINLHAVIASMNQQSIEVFQGFDIELKKSLDCANHRKIQLSIRLNASICPIRIQFFKGEGCGASVDDYFESVRTEYWITYLKRGE